MKAHLLFEQSGTFKKAFKEIGIEAFDYDIKNDYNQTDYQLDLFQEIKSAFIDKKSIFDQIKKEDIIFAFFPCIRFEDQITMSFRGENFSQKNWTDKEKLLYDIGLHRDLHELYNIITFLAIICIDRGFKLIIENPYNASHYLKRYWALKPKVIEYNRAKHGDFFVKPTQFWFINFDPKENVVMDKEYTVYEKIKNIVKSHNQKERSLMSPEYAEYFIKTYIL